MFAGSCRKEIGRKMSDGDRGIVGDWPEEESGERSGARGDQQGYSERRAKSSKGEDRREENQQSSVSNTNQSELNRGSSKRGFYCMAMGGK